MAPGAVTESSGNRASPLLFIKMHGAGNDYVFVDGFHSVLPENPPATARTVSDRHTGIGADGLICLLPPDNDSADVRMEMWNADGSPGTMCGNGVRCIALWMALCDRVERLCRISTASRTVDVTVIDIDRRNRTGRFTVDMGQPVFDAKFAESPERLMVACDRADNLRSFEFTEISMGNPHAVIFGESLSDENVLKFGPLIEAHERFPDRMNVEWAEVRSENQLQMRVWERGSGETRACGSGACAAGVAAVLRGVVDRGQSVQVCLPGGPLDICWLESGNVQMTGPACVVFTGEWWPAHRENL